MRSLKQFGLLAMAGMASMAFLGAGSASATKLYGSGGALGVGTEIIASSEESSSFVSTSASPVVTCAGVGFGAGVENAGGAGATVNGPAAAAFAGCTNSVTVIEGGRFEIHHISATTNGTLMGSGFLVTVHVAGLQCNYGTGTGTHLGTVTGSASGNAVIDVNAVVNEQAPKKALCPDTTLWTAKYIITSPSPLYVEAS